MIRGSRELIAAGIDQKIKELKPREFPVGHKFKAKYALP
jgi:hypothetical protein